MSNSTLSSDLVAGGADEDLIGISGGSSSWFWSSNWSSPSSSAGCSGGTKIRSPESEQLKPFALANAVCLVFGLLQVQYSWLDIPWGSNLLYYL